MIGPYNQGCNKWWKVIYKPSSCWLPWTAPTWFWLPWAKCYVPTGVHGSWHWMHLWLRTCLSWMRGYLCCGLACGFKSNRNRGLWRISWVLWRLRVHRLGITYVFVKLICTLPKVQSSQHRFFCWNGCLWIICWFNIKGPDVNNEKYHLT